MMSELILHLSDGDPRYIDLLREGAVNAVLAPDVNAEFVRRCGALGVRVMGQDAFRFVNWKQSFQAAHGAPLALTDGLRPGVGRPGEIGVASASRKPWITANGYLVAILRALRPGMPALLGYLPDTAEDLAAGRVSPYHVPELALVEARVAGGDYLLALDKHYSEALLAGNAKALASWLEMGRTVRWLNEHAALFGRSTHPALTVLVEPSEESAELVNLLFRQGTSPSLLRAAHPPHPGPSAPRTLIACGIQPPQGDARDRIVRLIQAGCTLVADNALETPWWRCAGLKSIRSQTDRAFFTLGRGQVVAYNDPIIEPSSFVSDCADLITPHRRAVRLWSANTAIATMTAGRTSGSSAVSIVNYGSPIDRDAMAHILGAYHKAELVRPEGETIVLKPIQRGPLTEVMIPELKRVAVIVLS